MQTIFCTECGAKNEYSGAKPKFCSSCGTPMSPSANKTNKQEVAKKNPSARKASSFKEQMEARKKSRDSSQEDETDIEYVPNISSLSYEIIKGGNPVHNFKDIVNAPEKNKESE
jgi:DNA-directed RNA polymerase subunit M/transcription elongation factor TFIIS